MPHQQYIIIPRTHNTLVDRSFAAAGPRLWNILRAHLHDEVISYNSFRHELKTFGFNVASGAQCDIPINLRYTNTLTKLN